MVPHTSALTCPLTCQNLNHKKHTECASLAPRHFTLLLPIHHQTEIHFQTDSNHYFSTHSSWKSFQIVHLFQWPVSLTQTHRFLTNYSLFTSINTKSSKRHWWLWLFISQIGAKRCRGYLCGYCYQGYRHDWCKSIALPMIVAHDYWQIVLSPTDPFEMDFWDILLPPSSTSPARSIDQAATSDVKEDFNILWLKSPSPSAGSTPDCDALWLDMSPDEVLIQYQ